MGCRKRLLTPCCMPHMLAGGEDPLSFGWWLARGACWSAACLPETQTGRQLAQYFRADSCRASVELLNAAMTVASCVSLLQRSDLPMPTADSEASSMLARNHRRKQPDLCLEGRSPGHMFDRLGQGTVYAAATCSWVSSLALPACCC